MNFLLYLGLTQEQLWGKKKGFASGLMGGKGQLASRASVLPILAQMVLTVLVSCHTGLDSSDSALKPTEANGGAEPIWVICSNDSSNIAHQLMDDDAVHSVSVVATRIDGTLVGEGNLAKRATAWEGSVPVTGTEPVVFIAFATSKDGATLYRGEGAHTIKAGGTDALPLTLSPVGQDPGAGLVLWGGYLYVLGGRDQAGGLRAEVWSTPVGSDGSVGDWRRQADLPVPLAYSSWVSTANMLYSLGGQDVTGARQGILYTLIVAGTLGFSSGAWETNVSKLPQPRTGALPLLTQGRIYLFGGGAPGDPYPPVVSARVWSDGQVGQWYEAYSPPPETEARVWGEVTVADKRYRVLSVRGTQPPELAELSTLSVRANQPQISPGSGIVKANSVLKVSCYPGDVVRYTTSVGSPPPEPSETSPVWTASTKVTASANYAFRAFRAGFPPSSVVYQSYWTRPANLFVLTQGTVTPRLAADGYQTMFLEEAQSSGTKEPVASVWHKIVVSTRATYRLGWRDASQSPEAYTARVSLSLFEGDLYTPVRLPDDSDFFEAKEGASPVILKLGPGTYYLLSQSEDASKGGSFGILLEKDG